MVHMGEGFQKGVSVPEGIDCSQRYQASRQGGLPQHKFTAFTVKAEGSEGVRVSEYQYGPPVAKRDFELFCGERNKLPFFAWAMGGEYGPARHGGSGAICTEGAQGGGGAEGDIGGDGAAVAVFVDVF